MVSANKEGVQTMWVKEQNLLCNMTKGSHSSRSCLWVVIHSIIVEGWGEEEERRGPTDFVVVWWLHR